MLVVLDVEVEVEVDVVDDVSDVLVVLEVLVDVLLVVVVLLDVVVDVVVVDCSSGMLVLTSTDVLVEVLVDVTASLRRGARGAESYRAARSAAARFLDGLPADTPLGVRALGLTPGRGCSSAVLLGGGRRQLTRDIGDQAEEFGQMKVLNAAAQISTEIDDLALAKLVHEQRRVV